MRHPQCVLLHDVLYVGGGDAPLEYMATIFMTKTTTEHFVWDVRPTPTNRYSLTTYHSQLVLVGGLDPYTEHASNGVWTLSTTGMNWQQSIPEMLTERSRPSAVNTGTPEYIVVAGGVGVGNSYLDIVEVFTGKEWCTVEPPPKPCYYLKWTSHEGKFYLCGDYVYSCDSKTFLESCEQSDGSKRPFPLWSNFQMPFELSSPTSFGQHLISIGGITESLICCPDIVAFFPLSQSWVSIGMLPTALYSAASIVLPTGELVVLGGDTGVSHSARVFKATLRGEGDNTLYYNYYNYYY